MNLFQLLTYFNITDFTDEKKNEGRKEGLRKKGRKKGREGGGKENEETGGRADIILFSLIEQKMHLKCH